MKHHPEGLPKVNALSLDSSHSGSTCTNFEHETDMDSSYNRAGSIQISVRDTGIGLSKEQLGMLFGEGIQFDVNR